MMSPNPTMSDGEHDFGQRLRAAREAAGLSVADVATQLRMPSHIVLALESGDHARIGAPVFVRGHLRSYSRLLGLPQAPMQAAVAGVAPVVPTKLVPRTQTPTLQRISDQIGGRMVYIVITAMMLVLPIWMATQSRGDLLPDAAPLDLPVDQAANPQQHGKPVAARQPSTVVASMATLPRQQQASAPGLALRFTDDSWVQVLGPDGATLEKALVKSGETRSYPAGAVGKVVLGNAAGVEVRTAGQIQHLDGFMRANVARFTVSSDGSLAQVKN